MIRLKSLRYKNAVTFHDTVLIPLEKQGRVFLAGDNKDTGGSNGAGKSTIFEVLQHILFSTTSKGFARNKFAGDGYFAELVLEADDHEYKILQFRGAKKQERKDGYKIKKDGVDVTPKGTRHMADCISYIKEIIGITEEEFRGYIYLAQEGQGHVLISGKGAEKRNYLSDLFNLDRYDTVKDGVEEELSTIKVQIAALSEKAAVRDEVESQLLEVDLDSAGFQTLLESVEATEVFIRDKDAVWGDKLKEADDARTRVTERLEVRSKLDTIFPNWHDIDVEEASEERQQKLRKLNSRINKLEDLADLLVTQAELSEGYVEDLEITETQASEALLKTQTSLAKLNSDLEGVHRRMVLEAKLPNVEAIGEDVPERLRTAEGALEVIKHKFSEGMASLDKLSKLTEAECPMCGKPLDVKAIAEQRNKMKIVVGTMDSALTTTKTEIQALSSLAKKLEEYNKLTAQIGELPVADAGEHNVAIAECSECITEMQGVLDQAKDNARIAKKLAGVVEAISAFPDNLDVDKLEEYREKSRKLEKAIGKLETLKTLKTQFSGMDEIEILPEVEYDHMAELAKFYRTAQADLAVQKQDAITQKDRSEKLHNRLEALDSQLAVWESVQHRKSLFEAMKAAYGPKGLKTHQLKKVSNAICRTLPKYTTIMFQEPRVEFFVDNDPDSTDIEFYIRRFTSEGTEEYPVGKLSGGEKKRLAVAMIFSLAELVSPRKRCNLVILDEVGDGLDPIGEEAFASQLLPQLHQDTVICTSHRPGIEAAQFDSHWKVTKENNHSTMVTG